MMALLSRFGKYGERYLVWLDGREIEIQNGNQYSIYPQIGDFSPEETDTICRVIESGAWPEADGKVTKIPCVLHPCTDKAPHFPHKNGAVSYNRSGTHKAMCPGIWAPDQKWHPMVRHHGRDGNMDQIAWCEIAPFRICVAEYWTTGGHHDSYIDYYKDIQSMNVDGDELQKQGIAFQEQGFCPVHGWESIQKDGKTYCCMER